MVTRRDVLRGAGAALGALALGAGTSGAGEGDAKRDPLPRRALGKTGVEVSILGLGGHHIGTGGEKEKLALIRRAVEEGITFLDNANDYNGGRSEERMGRALAEGKLREKVFLMTKCCDHARTKAGSLRSLEESLRRLRTDHLDLWQLHQIERDDDPERIFAKGGAVEALDEAKRKGLARFVGFTGHTAPALMKAMLARGYAFDTVQMPLNPVDPHEASFEREVLPLLVEASIGVIGMKSLASGSLARAGAVTASECRRYALSLPISTLVCGIDSEEILSQDLAVARGFTPLDEAARKALSAKVAGLAARGDVEWYKRR